MTCRDARHAARRPARAFRTAGMVLVCASTLLGLGLLGASRVDGNDRKSTGTGRAQNNATPARRPIATTRPAHSNATIDESAAQVAAYRVPARRAVAPAGAELMRFVPATATLNENVKPTQLPALPPAAPRTKIARTRTVRMEVTAYCPCTKCCGPNAQGITASGLPVSHNGGRFVAADTSLLPFRTKLLIPGYHAAAGPVEVIDRGGAIKGKRLDVYYPTHAEALEWGRQWVNVTVVAE